jgi:ribosomal protein S18 acetylase RimI-like enzyme
MEPADIEFAAASARAEGWSGQTRLVFDDFLAHDPRGCFIAEVNGRRAGICIATAYQRHGFVGTLIVAPKFRRIGLGTQLFSHAVRYLIDSGMQTISLDGDAPGIPIYLKAGFKKVCLSRRFNGNIAGMRHPSIHPMSLNDLDAVCTLDQRLFGDDRSFFIRRKYERYSKLSLVARQDGMLVGYLLANPGESVISVGPWAACPGLAYPPALLEHLAQVAPDEPMRIGVLESNQSAVAQLLTIPGLMESEPSWRMVLGNKHGPGSSECLYAIGSPAKG